MTFFFKRPKAVSEILGRVKVQTFTVPSVNVIAKKLFALGSPSFDGRGHCPQTYAAPFTLSELS